MTKAGIKTSSTNGEGEHAQLSRGERLCQRTGTPVTCIAHWVAHGMTGGFQHAGNDRCRMDP